jgi:2-polyprenyl-3-methyl-5-hydroxy-6-metoxy-1,4-benzoquinol methylase
MNMPLTDMNIQTESPDKAFEQLYITLRNKEQRLYTDAQLLQLPNIAATHVHYQEWQVRKHSAVRLTGYLAKKGKTLNILEIGCGNGWLANKLAQINNATVTGIDINEVEIEQAKRVLGNDNLLFLCKEFDTGRLYCQILLI